MDIQGAVPSTANDAAASGRVGSGESLAAERKEAEDSNIERKEVEASATGDGVGEKVDIQA